VKPTGPIPHHFGASESGQLLIGGYPAEELVAEAGGTPLFVYDNNIVGSQVARFKGAMADGIALHYAVTANPYEPLLEFLGRYVDGFRIVSQGELKRLQEAQLAGIPMNFAGPGKLDTELEAAVKVGATISVESEGEASRAIRAAERVGVQPKISVRVTPPFAIEEGRVSLGSRPSPFGVDADRVPSLVLGLIEAGVDWRGLHMFAGAQCLDAEALSEIHRVTVAHAGEIAEIIGMAIPELNLGGGFDVPCFDGEQPLDLYRMANALHEAFAKPLGVHREHQDAYARPPVGSFVTLELTLDRRLALAGDDRRRKAGQLERRLASPTRVHRGHHNACRAHRERLGECVIDEDGVDVHVSVLQREAASRARRQWDSSRIVRYRIDRSTARCRA